MQAALDHHGLPVRYITTLVPADHLADAVRGVKALGFKGFNCTLPHKVAVIEHLDGLGPSAEIMDAVNCVVERAGRSIGEHPAGEGLLASLPGRSRSKRRSRGRHPSPSAPAPRSAAKASSTCSTRAPTSPRHSFPGSEITPSARTSTSSATRHPSACSPTRPASPSM